MPSIYSDLNPIPTLGDSVYTSQSAIEIGIAMYFMIKKRQRLFDSSAGNTLETALFELDVSLESSYLITDIIIEELPTQVAAIEIVTNRIQIIPDLDNQRYSILLPYTVKNVEESEIHEFKGYLLKEAN